LDSSANDGPGAPLTSGPAGTAETTSRADVLSAPPVAPTGEIVDQDAGVSALTNGDDSTKDKKRKSKHEGETAEEKAERKRRKKEKKEKKEKRKSKADDSDDSD